MIARPVDLTVHRWRNIPVEDDSLPSTSVYSIDEESERDTLDGTVTRKLTVQLEHRIVALGPHPTETRDPPDDQIDPLIVWARQQILADPTLAVLVTDVEEKGWAKGVAETSEKNYVGARHDFLVVYESAEDDTQLPTITSQILTLVETALNEGAP